MFESFLQKVQQLRVIPVVVIDHKEDALPVADALVAGGLPAAEVTLRSDCALEVIKTMAKRGDILVGAGTVLTLEQSQAAVDAGAQFIVSPGFDAEVVSWCIQSSIPVLPGTVSPTEVIAARRVGLTCTKFFPAQQYGGVSTITSLTSVFKDHSFMPTGGVNPSNAAEYLKTPGVACVGGTWLTKKNLLEAKDYSKIQELCEEIRDILDAQGL